VGMLRLLTVVAFSPQISGDACPQEMHVDPERRANPAPLAANLDVLRLRGQQLIIPCSDRNGEFAIPISGTMNLELSDEETAACPEGTVSLSSSEREALIRELHATTRNSVAVTVI
jgi:hypothetical protein